MKIVMIGGSGLIGSRLVAKLRSHGHDAVPASPHTGVDTLTRAGLPEVLAGADVVVDVSNSPSLDAEAARAFFETSTRNLLEAEAVAGVRHHVALSVVGTDRLAAWGYFRAKTAQRMLIERSPIPYSLVHATQFFEFIGSIADAATDGTRVRLAPVLVQPMAADDVASAVGKIALSEPLNRVVEVAGPQQFRLDELVRRSLEWWNDPRRVVADPKARYFGAEVGGRDLLPSDDAVLGVTRFEQWITQGMRQQTPPPIPWLDRLTSTGRAVPVAHGQGR